MTTSDPLLRATPDNAQELFRRFGQVANGFSRDDVVNASVNILVNAIRQHCKTRQQAEQAFDELFGRTKQVLVDHYDQLGRKRGIFPFDQTIEIPLNDFRKDNKF